MPGAVSIFDSSSNMVFLHEWTYNLSAYILLSCIPVTDYPGCGGINDSDTDPEWQVDTFLLGEVTESPKSLSKFSHGKSVVFFFFFLQEQHQGSQDCWRYTPVNTWKPAVKHSRLYIYRLKGDEAQISSKSFQWDCLSSSVLSCFRFSSHIILRRWDGVSHPSPQRIQQKSIFFFYSWHWLGGVSMIDSTAFVLKARIFLWKSVLWFETVWTFSAASWFYEHALTHKGRIIWRCRCTFRPPRDECMCTPATLRALWNWLGGCESVSVIAPLWTWALGDK